MWKNCKGRGRRKQSTSQMNELVLHIGQYNQNRDQNEKEHENIDI